MPVERAQNRRRVRAAAAETRLHRDTLVDKDLQALRVKVGAQEKRLRRTPCQIVGVLREAVRFQNTLPRIVGRKPLAVAVQRPRRVRSDAYDHIVAQRNGLLNGADVVIAVGALSQNVQRQIQFCKGTFGDGLHYLIFLPSR